MTFAEYKWAEHEAPDALCSRCAKALEPQGWVRIESEHEVECCDNCGEHIDEDPPSEGYSYFDAVLLGDEYR